MIVKARTDALSGKRFRVLSLSGGGYLGVYTAALLAALELRAGEPLGRRFDLLAGTSVGGILAQEIAVILAGMGRAPGVVAMLDSYPADAWRDEPEAAFAALRRFILA